VGGVLRDKCFWLQSFTAPLWLVLKNSSNLWPQPQPMALIYKSGDDLRQDAFTLLLLRAMDRLWQEAGLDMRVTPYRVVATARAAGFIEVVPHAKTTAQISQVCSAFILLLMMILLIDNIQGAGGVSAVFKKTPIADWLKKHNTTTSKYARAVDNFVHSCAAYVVATYVIGIQDRHNDNIMISKSGHLFHSKPPPHPQDTYTVVFSHYTTI
jgi:phosphatidylinositol kinase/protein kinase (PI-3  family)